MAYKMKGSPMYRNFGVGGPMKKNGDPKKDPEKKEHSKEQKLKESEKVSESKEAGYHGKTYGSDYVPKIGEGIKNIAKTAMSTHPAGIMYEGVKKLFGKKSTSETAKAAGKAGKATGKSTKNILGKLYGK